MEKKLRGERLLPQILGLTASPGTGGAKILERAVEHVLQVRFYEFSFGFYCLFISLNCLSNVHSSYLLCFTFPQICANLDSAIVSTKNYAPELKKVVPRPMKTYDIVEKRPEVRKYRHGQSC